MNGRSIIVGLILLVMVAAVVVLGVQTSWFRQWELLSLGAAKEAKPPPARPPALVKVKPIQKRDITPRQFIVGTIRPRRISKIGSAASGRVEEFLVNEGKPVHKKQAIAQLRTATIKAEYDAAAAMHQAFAAEVERLEQSLDEEIKQADAMLKKSEFLANFLTAKRARAFTAGQAVSREDLEEIISLEKQAGASQQQAAASLAILKRTKDAKLKEARAKSDSAAAEARRLQEQLERHTVVAPFDGYVVEEHTETGEWVMQGGLVATVADLDVIEIRVPVLEDYISYCRLNADVKVEVPALPKGERTFDGKIVAIVQEANAKTRTFPVNVHVQNRSIGQEDSGKRLLLMAGMLARVKLPVGAIRKGALVVPFDAVNLDGDKRTVFIVEKDSNGKKEIARMVPVTLGAAVGNLVEIIGDVKEGGLIVFEGNERLRPGQEVTAVEDKKE